ALRRTRREDVRVCVVGDGTGRAELAREAGDELGRRVHLPGFVAADDVPDLLACFDVASLPQSVDRVGAFRYTTKLAEYLAAGLPVATGRLPLAYDLDGGWIWRLDGEAPWDDAYVASLAALMESVTPDDVAARRAPALEAARQFDLEEQRQRVKAFVEDLLA